MSSSYWREYQEAWKARALIPFENIEAAIIRKLGPEIMALPGTQQGFDTVGQELLHLVRTMQNKAYESGYGVAQMHIRDATDSKLERA